MCLRKEPLVETKAYSSMHRAILTYDKLLVRQAVRHFWWRAIGFRFLIGLTITSVVLVELVRQGDTSWRVGALGAVIVFAIHVNVGVCIDYYRHGLRKLNAMGAPQGTLEATEGSLSFFSGAGTASVPWSAIAEVWQFKTCWLILFSRSDYVTLPTAGLSPEFAAFILAQVRAAGGKVS